MTRKEFFLCKNRFRHKKILEVMIKSCNWNKTDIIIRTEPCDWGPNHYFYFFEILTRLDDFTVAVSKYAKKENKNNGTEGIVTEKGSISSLLVISKKNSCIVEEVDVVNDLKDTSKIYKIEQKYLDD